jgi:hypothetical protein
MYVHLKLECLGHARVSIKLATCYEMKHDFVGTYINVWENVYTQ